MSDNPFQQVGGETKSIPSSVRSPGLPPSALYEVTVKAAYFIPNPWDPQNKTDLAMHIELPSGFEHKIQKTVLINNSAKALNKKTGKMELLYTYVEMSHIIGAACPGKTLADVFPSMQTKKIEIYDFDTRKNVLKDVKMITDLVGRKLFIGLKRKISNKVEQQNGVWVNLPERKETLEFGVAGAFEDRRSFTEINDNVAPEDAKDIDKWEQANSGKDWDAYKPVAHANSGTPPGVTPSASPIVDFGA